MGNLASAIELFSNKQVRIPRHKKSIYLSAARSWIFNSILSQRVTTGLWNRRVAGDVFMLDGKTACFQDDDSDDLDERLRTCELHPTAVLSGVGNLMTLGEAAELENGVVNAYPEFRDGLREFKLQQMRRALRVVPGDMVWAHQDDIFSLEFNLPAGCYATMVLRELFDLESSHKSY
jgi:tRNA pseudouridine13 synthase